MARLAERFDAFPLTHGNAVALYPEGQAAIDAKLDAIRAARHHVHLEYFIFQPDELGQLFLTELARKARQGVQVRLLYDAIGSYRLRPRHLRQLRTAGGQACAFLPFRLLRRRVQINLRNHRKILVVDGRVGFTGGLNIGDEYLGKVPFFGPWRDTHLRVEGPAVESLQRLFAEDWDFAAGEHLQGPDYFPPPTPAGSVPVQVVASGPDQNLKAIRQVYLAAIQRARQRLWIASPYFVPDAALLDAICLAGYQGVDVRLLGLYRPDKWVPYFAARYYWGDVLAAGVKVYQYTRGMMHAKVLLVDGEWASVGSANLDNRSMHLNFEMNCLFYAPAVVAELEAAFRRDLHDAIELDREVFARRPFPGRLIENACRLLSPIL
jgi:cardiolipin synthase